MARTRGMMLCAAYALMLCWALTVHAATATQTYGEWFFSGGVDWSSVQGAALSALLGGALRTLRTLRSMRPTFRVFLETLGDAALALVSGLLMFLMLALYGSWRGQVSHLVSFALLVASGYLRGGVVDGLDSALKRGLAMSSDAAMSFLAGRLGVPVQPPTAPPVEPRVTEPGALP